MKKSSLHIYFNNTIAFLFFKILSLMFYRKNKDGKSVLFINTGNLGDTVISSMILENDDKLDKYNNAYLLIKNEFSGLFNNYNGRVKIIKWNYKRYKWNLFYRIKFLKLIKSFNLRNTYNLTSARGMTCDEIALLSCAKMKYCFNSNWVYLKKMYGKRMDNLYDKILCRDILNEYEKHKFVLKSLFSLQNVRISVTESGILNEKEFSTRSFLPSKDYVVISPMASIEEKTYGLKNYSIISDSLSKFTDVMLLGKESEKKICGEISRNNGRIKNFAGKYTFEEVLYIISHCKLFIGNDSGLTHVALKFDVPLIAIIGGGTFGRYFPYLESEKRIYLYNKLDCFGCEWNCIKSDQYCITEVLPSRVLDEANKLLGITPGNIVPHNLRA